MIDHGPFEGKMTDKKAYFRAYHLANRDKRNRRAKLNMKKWRERNRVPMKIKLALGLSTIAEARSLLDNSK